MIDRTNQRAHAAARHSEIAQIFLCFSLAEIDQLTLNLRADDHSLGREMMARVLLNGAGVLKCGTGSVFLRNRREIRFGDVAGEERGLRTEEEKVARHGFLVVGQFECDGRFSGIEVRKEFVDDGGLMSYGVDYEDLYRRAAGYVDKILKGAKPADLPVQQGTKFEFVINLKAAKQIGLTIPNRVLERANRVIK